MTKQPFLTKIKTVVLKHLFLNKAGGKNMPPKAKFKKEEIIAAALSIVREQGFDALTARALGTKLDSSARPIFTVFQSMEEVQTEVIATAREQYNSHIKEALSQSKDIHRFKCVGEQYIKFAISEPKLFQLLFMKEQEHMPNFTNILPIIEMNYEQILSSIEQEYGFDRSISQRIYQHLWVYTHGIATLCATKMCCFTKEEISNMMTEIFKSILKEIKGR